ncbi:MAG: sugar transferase [Alistipes sp.]|nr:sugar transferase [Alistipes sp.]
MYRKYIKRILDLIFSLTLIVFLLPLGIILTIVLSFTNGGNPFFIQERPGLNGKTFRLIKFRSMNNKRDANGKLLPDTERMTRAGTFIRKTSLDELPQLINIFRGEMSFIGPRPLLVSYLPLYNDFQGRRHEVRPGLTGWAQVNGRNTISWEQKFEMDVWYVNNMNFKNDVKILYLSFIKVLGRRDINSSESQTMELFRGNSNDR